MKRQFGALIAAATFAFAQAASASDAPPPSPAPKTHGFVLSLGVGPGLFTASSGAASNVRHFSGESLSLSLLVGGRVNRTFSLGGGYLRDEVFGLRVKDSAATGDEPDLSHNRFFTSIFGLFGDFMVPTRPELHLQAFLGYGTLFVTGRQQPFVGDIPNPSGFVYSAALSSEFRIGREFTLGAALRVLLANFSVNETQTGSTDVDVLIPALMVTGRYD